MRDAMLLALISCFTYFLFGFFICCTRMRAMTSACTSPRLPTLREICPVRAHQLIVNSLYFSCKEGEIALARYETWLAFLANVSIKPGREMNRRNRSDLRCPWGGRRAQDLTSRFEPAASLSNSNRSKPLTQLNFINYAGEENRRGA